MSVRLTFGLPGCGKSTDIAAQAYKFIYGTKLERLFGLKRYKNVYCNIDLAIDGVIKIDNDCVGKYMLEDCAILIDEATLFADSRGWKVFDEPHAHDTRLIHIVDSINYGLDTQINSIPTLSI